MPSSFFLFLFFKLLLACELMDAPLTWETVALSLWFACFVLKVIVIVSSFFPPKDIAVISSRIVINLEEKWKKENNIVMLDQSEAGMNVLNFSPDDKSKSSGASPCRADKNHAIMD